MPDMSAISEEMMGDYDPYTGLPMQNKVVPPTANYKTMTCKNFDESINIYIYIYNIYKRVNADTGTRAHSHMGQAI